MTSIFESNCQALFSNLQCHYWFTVSFTEETCCTFLETDVFFTKEISWRLSSSLCRHYAPKDVLLQCRLDKPRANSTDEKRNTTGVQKVGWPSEWLQDNRENSTDRWWRWECRCWGQCWCNWSWRLGRRRRWGRPGCGCRRCPVGCSAGTSACSRWCCGQTLSPSTQSLRGDTEEGESVNKQWSKEEGHELN